MFSLRTATPIRTGAPTRLSAAVTTLHRDFHPTRPAMYWELVDFVRKS